MVRLTASMKKLRKKPRKESEGTMTDEPSNSTEDNISTPTSRERRLRGDKNDDDVYDDSSSGSDGARDQINVDESGASRAIVNVNRGRLSFDSPMHSRRLSFDSPHMSPLVQTDLDDALQGLEQTMVSHLDDVIIQAERMSNPHSDASGADTVRKLSFFDDASEATFGESRKNSLTVHERKRLVQVSAARAQALHEELRIEQYGGRQSDIAEAALAELFLKEELLRETLTRSTPSAQEMELRAELAAGALCIVKPFAACFRAIGTAGEHLQHGAITAGEHLHHGAITAGEHLHTGASAVGEHIHSGAIIASEHLQTGALAVGEHLHSGAVVAGEHLHTGAVVAGEHLHSGVIVAAEHLRTGAIVAKQLLAEQWRDELRDMPRLTMADNAASGQLHPRPRRVERTGSTNADDGQLMPLVQAATLANKQLHGQEGTPDGALTGGVATKPRRPSTNHREVFIASSKKRTPSLTPSTTPVAPPRALQSQTEGAPATDNGAGVLDRPIPSSPESGAASSRRLSEGQFDKITSWLKQDHGGVPTTTEGNGATDDAIASWRRREGWLHTNAVSTTKARQASEETIFGRLLNVQLLTGLRRDEDDDRPSKDEDEQKATQTAGLRTQENVQGAPPDSVNASDGIEPYPIEEDRKADGARLIEEASLVAETLDVSEPIDVTEADDDAEKPVATGSLKAGRRRRGKREPNKKEREGQKEGLARPTTPSPKSWRSRDARKEGQREGQGHPTTPSPKSSRLTSSRKTLLGSKDRKDRRSRSVGRLSAPASTLESAPVLSQRALWRRLRSEPSRLDRDEEAEEEASVLEEVLEEEGDVCEADAAGAESGVSEGGADALVAVNQADLASDEPKGRALQLLEELRERADAQPSLEANPVEQLWTSLFPTAVEKPEVDVQTLEPPPIPPLELPTTAEPTVGEMTDPPVREPPSSTSDAVSEPTLKKQAVRSDAAADNFQLPPGWMWLRNSNAGVVTSASPAVAPAEVASIATRHPDVVHALTAKEYIVLDDLRDDLTDAASESTTRPSVGSAHRPSARETLPVSPHSGAPPSRSAHSSPFGWRASLSSPFAWRPSITSPFARLRSSPSPFSRRPSGSSSSVPLTSLDQHVHASTPPARARPSTRPAFWRQATHTSGMAIREGKAVADVATPDSHSTPKAHFAQLSHVFELRETTVAESQLSYDSPSARSDGASSASSAGSELSTARAATIKKVVIGRELRKHAKERHKASTSTRRTPAHGNAEQPRGVRSKEQSKGTMMTGVGGNDTPTIGMSSPPRAGVKAHKTTHKARSAVKLSSAELEMCSMGFSGVACSPFKQMERRG